MILNLSCRFAYLNQVVGKNPNDAVPYNNRGAAYLDLNQLQQALKDFNKAIAINKAYVTAYNNRGNTHYAMENYQVALADYEQSIRLNPKNAHTYFNRGLAYYQLKRTDLGADVNTKDVDNHTVLAWAEYKKHPKLAKILRKAAQIDLPSGNRFSCRICIIR